MLFFLIADAYCASNKCCADDYLSSLTGFFEALSAFIARHQAFYLLILKGINYAVCDTCAKGVALEIAKKVGGKIDLNKDFNLKEGAFEISDDAIT